MTSELETINSKAEEAQELLGQVSLQAVEVGVSHHHLLLLIGRGRLFQHTGVPSSRFAPRRGPREHVVLIAQSYREPPPLAGEGVRGELLCAYRFSGLRGLEVAIGPKYPSRYCSFR